MMSSDHWRRVKQVFAVVREQPATQQSVLLAEACGADILLQTDVRSLLTAHRQAGAFLEPMPPVIDAPDAAGVLDNQIGRTIGGYTLTRVLGYGGMGAVFEAEQSNPRRRVAIKIVRGGVLSDQQAARLFRREIQALALLNHPGIAALYESGHTDEGRHYFVMELVEGEPLTTHCIRQRLPIETRLDLFAALCDAVAYAHQRGVIHRDLKPGNILTTADGWPKILDFGLARITESDLAWTTHSRDAGKLQGTLAYMSPEQARGSSADIDVRSDTYTLGVLLYELLTQELPYDVRSAPLPHVLRVICDDAPRRPSVIQRTLRGDLETIILKALEKEPGRRYQSASEFAEDVRRFRAGLPVSARPPSAIYQIRKLAARNKVPAALLALLGTVVVTFAAGMSALYGQSQDHLARAREAEIQSGQRADRAEQLSSFFLDVLTNMSPEQSHYFGWHVQNSMWRVTGTAPAAIRGLIAENRAKVEAEQREQGDTPGVASRMFSLGILAAGRENHSEAERLIGEAVRIMRLHPEVFRRDLAFGLHALGVAIADTSRPEEAAAHFREALEVENASTGADGSLAIALQLRLASALMKAEGNAAAGPLAADALDRCRRLHGAESGLLMGPALRLQGELRLRCGDRAGAMEHFRSAVQVLMRCGLSNQETIMARGGLTASLLLLDREDEARVVVEESGVPARVLVQAGHHLRDIGCLELALPLFEKALPRAADSIVRYQATLAAYQTRAMLFGHDARYERELRNVLEQCTADYGPSDHRAHYIRMALAWMAVSRDPTSAGPAFEQALQIVEQWPGPTSLWAADCLQGLGVVRRNQCRLEEAEPLLRSSLELWETNVHAHHRALAQTRAEYGRCLRDLGRLAEAELHLSAAAADLERFFGSHSPQVRGIFKELVELHVARGRNADTELWKTRYRRAGEDAIRHYQDLLKAEKLPASDVQKRLTEARSALINCLFDWGRAPEALPHIRQLDRPAQPLVRLGRTQIHAAELEDARLLFEEALAVSSTPAERVAALLGQADLLRIGDLRFADSEALARDAHELSLRELGERDALTAQAARSAAFACVLQGRTSDAEAWLARYPPGVVEDGRPAAAHQAEAEIRLAAAQTALAEPLFRAALDAARTPGERVAALIGLARIAHEYRQQFDEAAALAEQAAALARTSFGERDTRTRHAQVQLSHSMLRVGRTDEAARLLEERLRIDAEWRGPDSAEVLLDRANLASIQGQRGDPAAAESCFRRILEARQARQPPDPLAIADVRARLGLCLAGRGALVEAEEHLLAGYSVIEARRGPQSLLACDLRRALISLYDTQGNTERATAWQSTR